MNNLKRQICGWLHSTWTQVQGIKQKTLPTSRGVIVGYIHGGAHEKHLEAHRAIKCIHFAQHKGVHFAR
jgi:hypothetical protein